MQEPPPSAPASNALSAEAQLLEEPGLPGFAPPPQAAAAPAGYRVRAVIGVHDRYDLALLEVEPPHHNGHTPMPLAVAAQAPPRLEERPVYLVAYPVHDGRRSEPEPITRIFRAWASRSTSPNMSRPAGRYGLA